MKFKVYLSGSRGNLGTVTDEKSTLIVDCGVVVRVARRAMDFGLSSVDAALCGHSHADHAKGMSGLMRIGIDCWMSKETAEELNLKGHRLHIFEPLKTFKIKSFSIKPFPLVHDVSNYGFLIKGHSGKYLMYAVDTAYVKYVFPPLSIIAIECNHDREILQDLVLAGHVNAEVGKRILKNHMSLQVLKEMLSANDMSQVEAIHLLHFSKFNADREQFKKEIQKLTGKPVYVK